MTPWGFGKKKLIEAAISFATKTQSFWPESLWRLQTWGKWNIQKLRAISGVERDQEFAESDYENPEIIQLKEMLVQKDEIILNMEKHKNQEYLLKEKLVEKDEEISNLK